MAQRGRPRGFDRDEALRGALHVFRERGYEGATLTELQGVMGDLTAPSLYAAFGSKEGLFKEAVELYRDTTMVATRRALEEGPTARASVEAMLRASVQSFCKPHEPRGCLIVLGARASSQMEDHLRGLRLATLKQIRRRLDRGVAEGDVAPRTDVAALANFYTTFLHGLSIQARDGVSRAALMAAVDCAMAPFPSG